MNPLEHELQCRCWSCSMRKDHAERLVKGSLIDKLLERAYQNPLVKKIADEIHHRRMMSGNACHGCIRMALYRIESDSHLTATPTL